ncbi:MAG: DUF6282 family protein [Bryobacteraceae bacterium]
MSLPDFLHGAIDLHVHSAPDIDPRRYDDFDLAREAAKAGMAAVLIKSHQASTVERAWLVSKVVTGIQVFGGLVLNETVGGLNPAAVRLALQLGAKEVWMPTRSSRNHRSRHGNPGGIAIQDAECRLLPQVEEILRLLAEGDCVLGTGHLAPEESAALIHRAREVGVRKILVTHPEWSATYFPIELQRQLAAGGGVFFERCFVSTTHRCGHTPFETIERAIEAVGVESTILSSDLGQPDTPPPVDGLRLYAERLRSSGFSPEQLRCMMRDNPRSLLLGS